MQKNTASQRIYVYAHDTSADAAKTGDAANITAQLSKDGAAAAATNDVNPTEIDATDHPGVYYFDMTQAETNADELLLTAVSSTSNIQLDRVVIYTRPANFPALGIESDGDVTKVNTLDGHTAQTADHTAAIATVDTVVDGIQTDLSNGTDGLGALKTLIDAIKAVTDNHPNSGAFSDLAAILTDTGTTLPATLSTIEGYIDTEVAAIKAKTDNLPAAPAATGDIPTVANIRTELDSNSTQLAAIVADTNELQTDWADGGRLDLILDSASAGGDPWATSLPGAYGAGTAGKIIGDNIDAPISTVDTVVDGIQTDLSNGTDGLGALKALIDTSNTTTAAILVDTGTTLPGTLTTILADTNELQTNQGNWLTATGFSTHSAADVNTAVEAGQVGTDTAAILIDTGTTLPAQITVVQNDLDIITGADGVNLLSASQASLDAIEADTNELQTDWADGGRLDLLLDSAGGGGGGDATEAKQDSIIALIGTPAADLAADIAAISVGAGSGPNPITITLTDGTNPIQSGTVGVYLNDVLKGSGVTDASGNVTLSLAAATYTVAAVAESHSFTPVTRTVTGSQAGTLTDDLEMTLITVSAPADPAMCRVTGTFVDIANNAIESATITFQLYGKVTGKAIKSTKLIKIAEYTATTDSDGALTDGTNAWLDLQRTDAMTPTDAEYRITATGFGLDGATFTTAATTYNLNDLIS